MGSAYYLQERGNKEGLLSLGEQGGYDKEGYFLDMRRSVSISVAAWTAEILKE